jgi:uncharacterized protein YcnI
MIRLAAFSIAGCVVAGTAAFAHVTLESREAPADSYAKLTFSVPHGCDGSPTVRIRVRVADGVTGVKPQPKPGWQVAIVKAKLEGRVVGSHGETITETISEVSWSGGRLLDEHFDEFAMQVRLPKAEPGTVLYFPVVQECEHGVTRWIEIPDAGKPGNLKEPAPALRLTPKPN